jgi:hypothetical protein
MLGLVSTLFWQPYVAVGPLPTMYWKESASRGPVAVLYWTASHKGFNYAFHSPLRWLQGRGRLVPSRPGGIACQLASASNGFEQRYS